MNLAKPREGQADLAAQEQNKHYELNYPNGRKRL